MAKVSITEEIKDLMRQNARSRAGWERLEAVAKRYDVEGNRVLDIGTLKDRWNGNYCCTSHVRQRE